MAIITNYTPRLARFLQSATAMIDKKFVVRTNPFLPMLGMKVASRPGAVSRYKVLPINISPLVRCVDDKGNMTPIAEYLIASAVAAYLASHLGYRGTNTAGFGVDTEWASSFLTGTAIDRLQNKKLALYHSLTLRFAMELAEKNILSENGYDPIDEDAERRLAQTFERDIWTFSDFSVMKNLQYMGLGTERPDPSVVRIFTYDDVVMLAGVYMYLPQSLKDVMLKSIGSILEGHLLRFIKSIGFAADIDATVLLADGFRRYYTPSLHGETIERAFGYLLGMGSMIFPRTTDEMNKENIDTGSIVLQLGRFYDAYENFDAVSGIDVSAQIRAAKTGLRKEKSDEYPNTSAVEIDRMILREMAIRGMRLAALSFQEDAFGIDTDLGEKVW